MNKIISFIRNHIKRGAIVIPVFILVYVLFEPADNFISKKDVKYTDFSTVIWSDSVKLNGVNGILMHMGKEYTFMPYDSIYFEREADGVMKSFDVPREDGKPLNFSVPPDSVNWGFMDSKHYENIP